MKYYVDTVSGFDDVREYDEIVQDMLQNSPAETEEEARKLVDEAIRNGELEEVAADSLEPAGFFDTGSVEKLAQALRDCEYAIPEDGLQEGRDYIYVLG